MSNSKKIILSGLLLALLIVLSRFVSIKTQILVISLAFLPIMISAIILGPKYSCLIAGLGDLIGALLFPFGEYFVGFTITALFSGLIYGLFLYNKKDGEFFTGKALIIRLILSSFLVVIGINLFIKSFMIHLLYGKAFIAVFTTRVIAELINLPIHVAVLYFINPFLVKYYHQFLTDND